MSGERWDTRFSSDRKRLRSSQPHSAKYLTQGGARRKTGLLLDSESELQALKYSRNTTFEKRYDTPASEEVGATQLNVAEGPFHSGTRGGGSHSRDALSRKSSQHSHKDESRHEPPVRTDILNYSQLCFMFSFSFCSWNKTTNALLLRIAWNMAKVFTVFCVGLLCVIKADEV